MLDQTRDEMHDVMRKNEKKYAQVHDPEFVADRVGLSSIVIQDLSARRNKNYEFNWTRMLSFEGEWMCGFSKIRLRSWGWRDGLRECV